MISRAHEIEAISRQAETECLHERAGCEFLRHKHIAENANTLPGDHYSILRKPSVAEVAAILARESGVGRRARWAVPGRRR